MSYWGRRLAELGALSEKVQREAREGRQLIESEPRTRGARAAAAALKGRPLSEAHKRKLRKPKGWQFGLPPHREREKP